MKSRKRVFFGILVVAMVAFLTPGVSPIYGPSALAKEDLEGVHLKVKGMTCQGCAERVKSNLSQLPEVKETSIDWKKGSVDTKVTKGSDHKALKDSIEKAGFTVSGVECECKG